MRLIVDLKCARIGELFEHKLVVPVAYPRRAIASTVASRERLWPDYQASMFDSASGIECNDALWHGAFPLTYSATQKKSY